MLIFRTLFSTAFIYFGFYYKKFLEHILKFDLKELYICIILQAFLFILANKITLGFNIHQMKFHNAVIPVIASLTGIYFSIFVTKRLINLVKDNSFIEKIGKNTYHIMANHYFIFYLISVLLYLIHGENISDLSYDMNKIGYKLHIYKYLYIIVSIVVSTYIGIFIKKISNKLFKKTI